MLQFLTGDELGNIKALRYSSGDTHGQNKTEIKTLYDGTANDTPNSIHALAVMSSSTGARLVATAHANGSASAFSLEGDDNLKVLKQWKETRLKPEHGYVGVTISDKGVYSCTSNGALRITPLAKDDKDPTPSLAALPTRLCDWHLSSNQETFAYGGDEVDLSLWDTERAFAPRLGSTDSSSTGTKKRKRNEALFPGEIWRAKNVSNDFLDLRQPIRITSLTYLSSAHQHHLLTGTQLGDVRRYDTRAARRPVSDWKNVGKVGGVKVVEKGQSEHELFVSDHGCNLFSLDLRNGRVVYGYKGLSGAVTSIAPSPSLLVSTSLDRYSRIHSTFPPPSLVGQNQDQKGEVLDKVFMKSIPTVVVWDQGAAMTESIQGATNAEDDDVWEEMENVEEQSDEETSKKKRAK